MLISSSVLFLCFLCIFIIIHILTRIFYRNFVSLSHFLCTYFKYYLFTYFFCMTITCIFLLIFTSLSFIKRLDIWGTAIKSMFWEEDFEYVTLTVPKAYSKISSVKNSTIYRSQTELVRTGMNPRVCVSTTWAASILYQ